MIVFMFEGTILTARKEYDEVKEECEIQIEYNNLLSERIRRIKTIKQLVNDQFNVAVAIDLLSELLLVNPKKRLTLKKF